MGGIINITTRDPESTEAFATVQGFVQPYRQYNTSDDYVGYAAEAGVGWKQKDGPFSLRLTGRFFRNDGHPQSFYGLIPVTGVPGIAVTGAVTDPEAVAAINEGRGIAQSPGTASNPIFAAQSAAKITQQQVKLKAGYDDGTITGQALFAFGAMPTINCHPIAICVTAQAISCAKARSPLVRRLIPRAVPTYPLLNATSIWLV